jgi:hypothetical protein
VPEQQTLLRARRWRLFDPVTACMVQVDREKRFAFFARLRQAGGMFFY